MTRQPAAVPGAPPSACTPWLTVIIPTLNEAETLPRTIRALQPGLASGAITIIVVDGGSEDETVSIAQGWGCTTLHCTRGRARQLNAGARLASTDHLWFLHADTLPPPDWLEQLQAAAQRQQPACFRLQFDHARHWSWLTLFGWMSQFDVQAFRYGDQSLFLPRSTFLAVYGYREEMSLLEDNDLVRRLTQRGNRPRVLTGRVTSSARRYERHGVVFTQSVYVGLYLAYRLGFSNARLKSVYDWAFSST